MKFIFKFVTFIPLIVLSFFAQAQQELQVQSNAVFSNNTSLSSFNTPAESQFLPVAQAFFFDFIQNDDQLILTWQIEPEYYLYQDKFNFSAEKATIGKVELPEAIPYEDEFFGQVQIYRDQLSLTIPLLEAQKQSSVTVQYQGCADAGFCYPPDTLHIPLDQVLASANISENASENKNNEVSTYINETSEKSNENKDIVTNNLSQEGQFSQTLTDHWWAPLAFLLLGVGLAFTPCVLPMYPIISGIILGRDNLTTKKAALLAFTYVQGMALTYTLLGLVVASFGAKFQAMMQHPYVLISISLLFILLSLAMFGVYNLQLPSRLQTWLNERSQSQASGQFGGVFIMGAISGLVCSPCITAPLSGALLYVAQTGDLTTGAITLYMLALGMGIPLILFVVFGQNLLPKAGAWMNIIKHLFGFILLAVAVYLLDRMIANNITFILYGILGIVGFGWLYHSLRQISTKSLLMSVAHLLTFVGFIISLWIGYQGIQGKQTLTFIANTGQETTQTSNKVKFVRIKTVQDLNQQLAIAKAQGKAVMFDYYADWCTACHQFDKYTFNAPNVAPLLNNMLLIQADVTKADAQDVELMEYLQVFGLPTIEFWNAQGEHLPQARLAGFVDANLFLQHLQQNNLVIQ